MFSDIYNNTTDFNYFPEENIQFADYATPQATISLLMMPENQTYTLTGIQLDFNQANGFIQLPSLLYNIENESKISFDNCRISYWSYLKDMYVHVGLYPVSKYSFIPIHDLKADEKSATIVLRAQRLPSSASQVKFNEINMTALSTEASEQEETGELRKKIRAKEKTIAEAIELVRQWRVLYNGGVDSITGEPVKMSLEEGARKLKCAKKSLDDYLLMIKHAKNYGFDFQSHQNEGFGYLRAFVKRAKAESEAIADEQSEKRAAPIRKQSKKIGSKRF